MILKSISQRKRKIGYYSVAFKAYIKNWRFTSIAEAGITKSQLNRLLHTYIYVVIFLTIIPEAHPSIAIICQQFAFVHVWLYFFGEQFTFVDKGFHFLCQQIAFEHAWEHFFHEQLAFEHVWLGFLGEQLAFVGKGLLKEGNLLPKRPLYEAIAPINRCPFILLMNPCQIQIQRMCITLLAKDKV